MLYTEYLQAAQKHIDACKSILIQYEDKSIPIPVLRELYYLSGYVVEGACVYAIYKLYGWTDSLDITEYDPVFTNTTKLDYYKKGCRKDEHKQPIMTNATYYISSHGFWRYVQLLDDFWAHLQTPVF